MTSLVSLLTECSPLSKYLYHTITSLFRCRCTCEEVIPRFLGECGECKVLVLLPEWDPGRHWVSSLGRISATEYENLAVLLGLPVTLGEGGGGVKVCSTILYWPHVLSPCWAYSMQWGS